MSDYRYKQNKSIDWAYDDKHDVIHFKSGDCRKMYNFTDKFIMEHPNFCKEYRKYFCCEESLFTDPLSIVNYIETFNLPIRLWSNYVDEEFEDIQAVKEWINNEYGGINRHQLYKYDLETRGYIGLDGEK